MTQRGAKQPDKTSKNRCRDKTWGWPEGSTVRRNRYAPVCYRIWCPPLQRAEEEAEQHLLDPPSRDLTVLDVTSPAVRDRKDGVGRDTAAGQHLCGFGRFSRFIKRTEHGKLRRAGAAASVDQRRVSSEDISVFFLSRRRFHGLTGSDALITVWLTVSGVGWGFWAAKWPQHISVRL